MTLAHKTLFETSSKLSIDARTRVIETLDACLVDGVDLATQVKVAHWNVKGPHFAALHPHFDALAGLVAGFDDEIAERAVALGGLASATARQCAARSRLPDYPTDLTRDQHHVETLVQRLDAWLDGLREARAVGEQAQDTDTVDLLTGVITEVEKQAWFLRATLES